MQRGGPTHRFEYPGRRVVDGGDEASGELAEWAKRPPFYVLGKGPPQVVVGRYADEKTWEKLHELGLRTTSIEEKQNYYNALAVASVAGK